MTFYHIGSSNPADFITRGTSSNLLFKSNFFSDPSYDKSLLAFCTPQDGGLKLCLCCLYSNQTNDCIVPMDIYEFFGKLCRVVHYFRKVVYNLNDRLKSRHKSSLTNVHAQECASDHTAKYILRCAQKVDYAAVFDFHHLINQLNLTSSDGVIQFKGKCAKMKGFKFHKFSILLHKNSKPTFLLIYEYHYTLGHAGIYKVLSLLGNVSVYPRDT